MNKHFLKEIQINKFKGFTNFKVNNLKRVNLIGGKNNIGKTSFMEASYINVTSENISFLASALYNIKYRRENLNLLTGGMLKLVHFANGISGAGVEANISQEMSFINGASGLDIGSNVSPSIKFNASSIDGKIIYKFSINFVSIEINIKELSFVNEINFKHQYIDSFGCGYNEIVAFYSVLQRQNKEAFLDDLISQLDPQIESFKIINGVPSCEINKQWIVLNELGDGTRHLISIITSMFAAEGGYIFIDEVDNGVHYTFLDELWKQIFKLSKVLNCQVFATTHSRECIEAFNRANEADDGVYLEFYRNEKNQQIQVKHRGYQQLDYSLNSNGEFRGE